MIRHLFIISLIFTLYGCSPGVEVDNSPEAQAIQADLQQKNSLQADFEEMVQVLELNSNEQGALEKRFVERERALTEWLEGAKGQQLIALEAKMKEQTQSKDLQGLKATIAQAKPLREEIVKFIQSSKNDMLDSLGPDRRAQWEGYEVCRKLFEVMEPLVLDETQKEDIYYESIEALLRARQSGESNPKAAAFLQLEQWAEQQVLDNAQYDIYQAIKQSQPMRSLGI